ncbi:MAG: Rpn family recombination-promoting nuclease/putative transposase [Symploca sp. SIO1C2]|nr:Rpn family recombination-promoting nuclease/putative transposase [Symploca sp. SIO1C2]
MRTDTLFYKVFQTFPGAMFELLGEDITLAQNYTFKSIELKEVAKRTHTDSLFYNVFQTFPGTLFELLGEDTTPAQNYTFQSIELKEVAKRTDGVFFPKRDGDPIYFVEVQFQPDEHLYYRLMQDVFVFLGQNRWKYGWQAVVFWAKRSLDPGIPQCYDAQVKAGNLKVFYLEDTPNTANSIALGLVRLVIEPTSNIENRVRQLETSVRALPVQQQRNAIELVEQALVYKFPDRPWRELEAMFGLTEWKQTRFYQEVEAEGIQKGIQQNTIVIARSCKQQGLDIETIMAITKLSREEIEAL